MVMQYVTLTRIHYKKQWLLQTSCIGQVSTVAANESLHYHVQIPLLHRQGFIFFHFNISWGEVINGDIFLIFFYLKKIFNLTSELKFSLINLLFDKSLKFLFKNAFVDKI